MTPKLKKGYIYTGLIFWVVALLCWIPVFTYAPPNLSAGQDDLGGAAITTLCMCISSMFFIPGALFVFLELGRFSWLKLRQFHRSSTAIQ
jgi:hypothetical protein